MHGEKPKKAQPTKKAGEQKKANAPPKKAKQQKKFDHAAKAVEVRSAYKTSVEGMVNTGFILSNYQAELKDDREFARFWRGHLGWARSTVYRLVDVGKHFADLNGKTLSYFDLSALYLLAAASVKDALRKKAIKLAEKGEYVSHAQVREWLGKKGKAGAKAGGGTGTSRSLTVLKSEWNAKAKGRGLDAEKVMAMLKDLGIEVRWSDATAKPKKEGTA